MTRSKYAGRKGRSSKKDHVKEDIVEDPETYHRCKLNPKQKRIREW